MRGDAIAAGCRSFRSAHRWWFWRASVARWAREQETSPTRGVRLFRKLSSGNQVGPEGYSRISLLKLAQRCSGSAASDRASTDRERTGAVKDGQDLDKLAPEPIDHPIVANDYFAK